MSVSSEPHEDPASVYVMTTPSGYFKIGMAKDAKFRQRTFQTANPEPLTLWTWFNYPGVPTLTLERELQQQLLLFRARGEWFRLPPAFMTAIFGRAEKLTVCKLAYPKLFARWQRKRRAADKAREAEK